MMVSFVSVFYHIYILSSLFQPSTTLDITFFFIQQVQHTIVRHKQTQNGTRNKAENNSGVQFIVRTMIDIGALLLRVFVLLCILLGISVIETAQLYHRSSEKTNPTKPSILPTPPSEKCDVIPIASSPIMDCHAPINGRNDDDTAVTPAPSGPTPPDQKLESKQQQTIVDTTHVDKPSPHPNDLFLSQPPEHVPNQMEPIDKEIIVESEPVLPPEHVPNQMKPVDKKAIVDSEPVLPPMKPIDKKTIVESEPVLPPSPLLASVQTTTPPQNDTNDVTEPTVSEMPDHAPMPSPTSSMRNKEDYEQPSLPPMPPVPCLPPLSPSGSLSSSLSTLAHTHSNHNQHQPLPHHHSTSRLHQAYIEKQQQPKIDPVASLPRPYSSYSARTHLSETPSPPQPQGSSLSMKLNKLKKPGRRLSQLFKKKNKNKTDQ